VTAIADGLEECIGSLEPGSVQITLILTSPDANSATALRTALQPRIDTPAQATTFFGLPITTAPTITAGVAVPSPPPSAPSLPPSTPPAGDGGLPLIIIIAIAAGGGALLLLVILIGVVCWRSRGGGGSPETPLRTSLSSTDTYKVGDENGLPVLVARM
jgi:hypothetical protein